MANIDPKQAVGEALGIFNIKTVVFIDDIFGFEIDNSDIIGLIEAQSINNYRALQSITEIKNINFNTIRDVWEAEVTARLENMDNNLKHKVRSELYVLSKLTDENETLRPMSQLKGIIPKKIKFLTLTPAEWQKEKDDILKSANQDNRILCLFDQEMKPHLGIELLKNAIDTACDGAIICALLTHIIATNQELETWRSFAQEHDLPLSSFLILSKTRLENPEDFAEGVKITLLNQNCETLKNDVCNLLMQAQNVASNELKSINVYDFYYMVLESSATEGVWEVQTLLRLFNLFHEREAQRAALEDTKRMQLNVLIKKIRNINKIGLYEKSLLPEQTWKIRQKELYHKEVNQLHLPLELGDIFETTSGKQYILVAQPCELMLRSNGVRDITEKVTLLEVVAKGRTYKWELPYFDVETGASADADFKSSICVNLDILDLAIFNKNGISTYTAALQAHTLHTPLSNRLAKITERMEANLLEYKGLNAAVKKSNINASMKSQLTNALIEKYFPEKTILPIEIDDQSIKFGIKRIGRYCYPFSGRLLDEYGKFLTRPADEHNIAKEIPKANSAINEDKPSAVAG